MRSRIAIFEGYGSPFRGSLNGPFGRRGYRVDPKYRVKAGKTVLVRDGYRVKPAKDTPAQKKFARCAKRCSRTKGRFTKCMKVCVRRKKSKR